MLGAIIGDVAGSYYEVLEINEYKKNHRPRCYEERIKILDKNVNLFTDMCSCTDDSILTCAIYDSIVNGDCSYEEYLKRYGLKEMDLGVDKYGRSRFGSGFVKWLKGDFLGDSFGNGAAMRVSPVGYMFDSLEEVKAQSRLATIPSHNHPDAIKGAEAVAVSIFLLRTGHSKEDVYKYITENYYELDFEMKELQRNNMFSSKSSITVPQALFVFFQSSDFEDSIRKAISIGGDTDTIACIVGSISEAHYGISDDLKMKIKPYMRDYMVELLGKRYFNDYKKEIK